MKCSIDYLFSNLPNKTQFDLKIINGIKIVIAL